MLGFRFVQVLSLFSVLSLVQLHAESSTFFNFRVQSHKEFAFSLRAIKLGLLSNLRTIDFGDFCG